MLSTSLYGALNLEISFSVRNILIDDHYAKDYLALRDGETRLNARIYFGKSSYLLNDLHKLDRLVQQYQQIADENLYVAGKCSFNKIFNLQYVEMSI